MTRKSLLSWLVVILIATSFALWMRSIHLMNQYEESGVFLVAVVIVPPLTVLTAIHLANLDK